MGRRHGSITVKRVRVEEKGVKEKKVKLKTFQVDIPRLQLPSREESPSAVPFTIKEDDDSDSDDKTPRNETDLTATAREPITERSSATIATGSASTMHKRVEEAMRAVKREIHVLRSYNHVNIIQLMGFSMCDSDSCVITDANDNCVGSKGKGKGGTGTGTGTGTDTGTEIESASVTAWTEDSENSRSYYSTNGAWFTPICLVYEYTSSGSLDQLLQHDVRASAVTWPVRCSIALGIASALNFLHCRDPSHAAYHRDIKSANIALTGDLCPKVL